MNSRVLPADLRSLARPRRDTPIDADEGVDVRALGQAVWRRRWTILGAMLGLGLLAWLATSQVTPTYTAMSKVMLEARKAQIAPAEQVVSDLDLSEQVVNGEAAYLQSNVLLSEVIARIGPERLAPMDPWPEGGADGLSERLVWAIRDNLVVYPEGDSYVIAIVADSEDPELAALIANTIAETYIARQIEARRDTTSEATVWLERRVDELRADVEAAEARVADYRARSLVEDGGSLDTASQQLADLNARLIEARADRVTAEARYGQLQAVIDREGLDGAGRIVTSPLIEDLNAERIDLERRDSVWAQDYGPDHPERRKIDTALTQVRDQLRAEIGRIVEQRRSDLEVAQAREQSLMDGIADLEERVLSISSNALGLRQLQREADAKRQTYAAFLARLTETRTQEQLQQPDARLIERATVPGAPSAPRPKLMGALGAMVGLSLGLGLVFFLEMTAQTYRSVRELESGTGLPVLAAIPEQRWKSLPDAAAMLAADPYAAYGERIRQLRTALMVQDGREGARAVLMLSAAPGEGKTTTTLALAQMAALAGKAVIVIDADLRRSALQSAFAWQMEEGEDFAAFIRGTCSLDRAIYTDPDLDIDILAAAEPDATLADRLDTSWLAPVVEELKRVYDLVLIDAPALLAVSDALVLAQVVDTRVFLVRWETTPRKAVAQGLAALEEAGLPLTGTALTMVDPAKSPDTYAESYAHE